MEQREGTCPTLAWLEEKDLWEVLGIKYTNYVLTAPILISAESGTGCLFKKVKQLLVIKTFMPASISKFQANEFPHR